MRKITKKNSSDSFSPKRFDLKRAYFPRWFKNSLRFTLGANSKLLSCALPFFDRLPPEIKEE